MRCERAYHDELTLEELKTLSKQETKESKKGMLSDEEDNKNR